VNTTTKVKLSGGAVGTIAKDPGAADRFLWSVRFPAHTCYMVGDSKGLHPDRWHCALGEQFQRPDIPQSFRSGVATTEAKAHQAIEDANMEGRPTGGAKQFAMYHRT
jgi:hypothetical protein